MHRQISELLTESQLHELMDRFVGGSPILPRVAREQIRNTNLSASGDTSVKHSEPEPGRSKSRFAAQRLTVFASAAAILAIMVTLHLTGGLDWWSSHAESVAVDSRPPENANGKDPGVATLTQLVDATWAAEAPVYQHGQQLHSGSRIALASGLAKVTYDCGAEVALQGPCDFLVRDHMVGVIKTGKLTANVPRRAFSFAILSPQADFVDLGTAFGIDVASDGRTQLHVFEGEVLYSQSKGANAPSNQVIHVTSNQAVEFSSAQALPSRIKLSEKQFSELFAMRRAAEFASGHVPEDALALWLAADVAVTIDAHQRVISWQDIIYGDNTAGEDAIQPESDARPQLVKDALHGRPAVRFDGNSDYLLTTPLETTDDQTVVIVCQFSADAFRKDRRWGGQIINYDGPPSRYLSNTLEPGVLQIGEPLLENEFKPTWLTGQVFAGFIGSATVESGRVDAMPVGADAPVVVAYCYELSNASARLAINGKQFGETRAFAPQAITSRKIIGRHAWMQNFFHGDLAELMIFNRALSPDELAQTTTYLAEKYGVKIDDLAIRPTSSTTP